MLQELQEISIFDRKDSYYEVFFHDHILKPYQYPEHFENLISALNRLYKEKKVFCKKLKEKTWITRVYLNASNPYAEMLVDIIEDIFDKAGAISYKSTLTLPIIKNRIAEDYTLPLKNCICIEGRFTTYTFKELEYLDILGYSDMFWRGYIDMLIPLLQYSKEPVNVQITKKSAQCVVDYIRNICMPKLPERRKMRITFDEEFETILVKFYWDWNDKGENK